MRKIARYIVGALALASASVVAVAPAQARWYADWHHGWHDHDDWRWRRGPGIAVGAGLLGAATGVAIANAYNPYLYPAPPLIVGPVPICRTRLIWDGWRRAYVPVSRCF